MFCQAPVLLRFTHASTVTPVVAFSELEEGTLTMSSTPSNETALLVSAVSAPGWPSVTPFR